MTSPDRPDLAAVQERCREQAGRPYVWGQAGPSGYDCAGWVELVRTDPGECARRLRDVVRKVSRDRRRERLRRLVGILRGARQ